MRLICCHIENFGKLHDVTVEFQPGCQIICEENGWGKSTLAAFIRVMFFGFEGENRRKNIENERKRYAPWQGGGYGGSLTFETGDSAYTVTRIFGDKKINDSFELRDAGTNLLSADFTENLGEELFLINSESFMRTVFIGQNDCETAATDSINARISNITDNMNDLDCYEKASGALQETLNKLNPRRKTGEIYKLNDRVTHLQTEVSQGVSLEESIRKYEDMDARERQHLQEIKTQQEALYEQQREASREQDARAKRAAYEQICGNYEEKKTAYLQAEAYFPGEIPTEEELRTYMAACDEMERAAEGTKICRLSDEEQEQLRILKEELEQYQAADEEQEQRRIRKEESEQYQAADAESVQLTGRETAVQEQNQIAVFGNTDISEEDLQSGRTSEQTGRNVPNMRETNINRPPADEEMNINGNPADEGTDSSVSSHGGSYGQIGAGALFLIAGVIFLFLFGNSGRGLTILAALLAVVGTLFLIVGVMTGQRYIREEQRRREEQLRQEEARRREREEAERIRQAEEERRRWEAEQVRQREEERLRWEAEQARQMEEEQRRWEAERLAAEHAQKKNQYETLGKKNRDCQAYRGQYEEKKEILSGAFQKMGFPFPDKPRNRLQTVWHQRIRWQQAKRDLDATLQKKQEFESQQDMSSLRLILSRQNETLPGGGQLVREEDSDERDRNGLPAERMTKTPDADQKGISTLEELNQRQRQLDRQADEIKDQLEIYRSQLTSLREKYDEWVQTKEQLQQEKDRLKAMRRQYRQVQRAQEYLTTAKETLTARYMEPLMNSFSRYYQTVVGTSGTAADRYHMDANTKITVEEEGMQRETAYLSRGYQDLIGLCLRLALVDAMYQTERPFLILDDPFVNLDAEKTAGGMRLLEEISREYQVIYFTAN
ncbi:MAG: AAA family ATPase [Clostridiales bacterium]|nr:AAA family ATPase [Clostridiales bacterium]